MANKSGYFVDKDGNILLTATSGENVLLKDGTDLETKLTNISQMVSGTLISSEGTTVNYQSLNKIGKVVSLIAYISVETPASWKVVAKLPQGFEPVFELFSVMSNTTSTTTPFAQISILDNGNIRLANGLPSANQSYCVCATWFTN